MDLAKIRAEYPILDRKIYNRPLVYLDNTATSQTPREVVDSIVSGYTRTKANVHRGVHTLSMEATELQEGARRRVREFINAPSTEEIIFTRGTTEAINLVAASYGGAFFKDGDEIILSVMEHHSNIVPWQLLQQRIDLKIRVIPIREDGSLDMDVYRSLFNERTRFVSVCHASNVLGTVNPVGEIVAEAHAHGVPVLIDGAQAAPHLKIDVQEIGADFYAFSAHKMYGPAGVGVLFGRREMLEKMPPYQGGGEMIESVSFEKTTYAELPYKFEAGTPDFIGIAALHKAIDYMESIGIDNIAAHEHDLLEYTTARMLAEIPGLKIFGTAPGKCAIISFLVDGEHHYDMGMLLDKLGIAVRTGHHCAQPLMTALGIDGTVRASFAVYNTREECDLFLSALKRVSDMLR
ncbi:MAG: cysteine desulfurase [Bacteroides sp.]|nr:cysteine desulfurase [Bacteroides sp.]MBD5354813.1 cysteine desulfurase [Bacteroides sp.]MDE6431654.1 cysteine desulfurase [Duncaniella sp.]MDE6823665.1 cysteine desulfurase [Duncaniella sp.]